MKKGSWYLKYGELGINQTRKILHQSAFLEIWLPEVNKMNAGKVGEPYTYPDSMIRFLTVLYAKGFEYRALEGIMEDYLDTL